MDARDLALVAVFAYRRFFPAAAAAPAKAAPAPEAPAPEAAQLLQKNPGAAVTSPRDSAANNRVEVPMYDTFDTSIKPDYTEEVGKQNTIRHLENRGHPSDEARRDFMAELSKDLTHHKDAHMQEVAAEELVSDDSAPAGEEEEEEARD